MLSNETPLGVWFVMNGHSLLIEKADLSEAGLATKLRQLVANMNAADAPPWSQQVMGSALLSVANALAGDDPHYLLTLVGKKTGERPQPFAKIKAIMDADECARYCYETSKEHLSMKRVVGLAGDKFVIGRTAVREAIKTAALFYRNQIEIDQEYRLNFYPTDDYAKWLFRRTKVRPPKL